MDIEIEGNTTHVEVGIATYEIKAQRHLHNMVELFADKCPKTAENFR
jgi:hypothetical protein